MNVLRPPTSPTRTPANRLLTVMTTAVGALTVTCLLIVLFGGVRGTEFSPDSFQRRTFKFYQIPLLRLQILPVYRDDVTNNLEQYLRRQKLIPAAAVAARWDVVSVQEVGAGREGDASILCRYLDDEDEKGNHRWLDWTQEHSELAETFWAAIHQAASLDAYFLTPEMFELASSAADEATFAHDLDRLLADRYVALADDYSALGRYRQAARYYSAAFGRNPQNPSLQDKKAAAEMRLEDELE